MAKKEDVAAQAQKLMGDITNIRNIGIVAHIDHGKCVAPSTRVQLADGRTPNAEELYSESILTGEKVRENENETVFALKNPVFIFSVDKRSGRIEKKSISHAWKLKGGEMLRMKLRNGNEISTTPEHKYLVFNGIEFEFKEAKALKAGEKITVARKFSCESRKDLSEYALKLLSQKPFYVFLNKQSAEALKGILSKSGHSGFCQITKRKISAKTYYDCLNKGRYLLQDIISLCNHFEIKISDCSGWIETIGLKDSIKIRWQSDWGELFYLAGLMIGDGSYNRFVVGKRELGDKFEKICGNLGFKPIERKFPGKTFEYQTNTTLLYLLNVLFDYPLKKKSHNVKISAFARQAPDYLLAELLKAYYDCDGTVERARSAISISSASRSMLKDLQLVLPRFGCVPILGKNNTMYITGNSSKNFVGNIGFCLREKQAKAVGLSEKSEGSIVCDTVPCQGLKKLRTESKNRISHHYYKYENLIYSPQRQTYRQIMATLLKEKDVQIPNIDDLAFIEIKEIKKEFEEAVYDFSVPENQNFIAEGIVVHNTTLTDSLVAVAGLISQELAGKQLFMDSYALEQARGITINASNVSIVYPYKNKDHLINIIDTPGHIDFGGDVIRAMRAVDGVVVVVDSVEGPMPQTETVIRQALKENAKPVLFINKSDRLVNELQLNQQQMQERFIKTITAVNKLIRKNAPKGKEEEWLVKVDDGSVVFGSAYYKWAVSVPRMKESGVTFKDVFEHCKSGTQPELAKKAPLHAALLEMVINHLPNPAQAQKYRIPIIWKGDIESESGKDMISCNPNGKFAMMVTDVSIDPHAGDIATGRVYSGVAKRGLQVYSLGLKKMVTISQVAVFMGPDRAPVEEVPAGNIAALVGLKEVYAGETLASEEIHPFEDFMSTAEPVITVSIEAKSTKDLPKLIEVIKQITKEDPNLRATLNQETGEHLLSGMGELHLEVAQYRIETDHKVPIKVGAPIVVYRETITKKSPVFEAKSPNKHNKFKIRVEPIESEVLEKLREAKIEGKVKPKDKEAIERFKECGVDNEESKCIWAVYNNCYLVDGTRGIQALHEIRELVMQGFKDATDSGPLAKEKCVGFKFILEDAKLHEDAIHRGPAQVLPAITRGIYGCMMGADPIILEPKQILTITVAQDYLGAVSRELNARRAQILDMRSEGDTNIIISKAPVKELIGFSQSIRGATQGRAIWTAEYAGFEPLPREMQASVIKEVRARKGMDLEVKKSDFWLE